MLSGIFNNLYRQSLIWLSLLIPFRCLKFSKIDIFTVLCISLQRQCEKFKKDRDAFKQMLESAQKKIGELKSNTGRQSRSSMHSSDDDDKSKIAYLEQQVCYYIYLVSSIPQLNFNVEPC